MAVSLRVPEDVKKRIARLADAQETTAHAFMLAAIRDKVEADEAREAFHAEGRRRLTRMKKSGAGIPAADVFDYLDARGKGRRPARPTPRRTP